MRYRLLLLFMAVLLFSAVVFQNGISVFIASTLILIVSQIVLVILIFLFPDRIISFIPISLLSILILQSILLLGNLVGIMANSMNVDALSEIIVKALVFDSQGIVIIMVLIMSIISYRLIIQRPVSSFARSLLDEMPVAQIKIDNDLLKGYITDDDAYANRMLLRFRMDIAGALDGTTILHGRAIIALTFVIIVSMICNKLGLLKIGTLNGNGVLALFFGFYIVILAMSSLIIRLSVHKVQSIKKLEVNKI